LFLFLVQIRVIRGEIKDEHIVTQKAVKINAVGKVIWKEKVPGKT
jgi:hypothetical protein